MRARAMLFAVVVLCGAGFGAWRLAQAAVGWYEAAVAGKAGDALAAAGQNWASVAVDGTRLTLKGAAPDESSRFGALELVRQVVDPSRIEDTTTVAVAAPLPPAPIALELLRNDADVSLIGLVPETGGRDLIRSALGAGRIDEHVTDMLEASSEPAPAGWTEALGFGLSVLAELPRTKISVAPGKVSVAAVTDDDAGREALEARLRRAVPDGVALELDVSAPRPVIAPFTFDLTLRDGVAALESCSADSPEAAARILAAARAVGVDAAADCRIGVGAPSPDWAAAAASGADALRRLGGGEFALTDLAARLTAPAGTPGDTVADAAASLGAALPARFTLTTIAVTAPAATTVAPAPTVAAPVFEAALRQGGTVRLTGPVRDPTSQQAIASYAASLFGHDRVTDATVTDPALPEGWPGRVLAGIEALAELRQGDLRVTPDRVALTGWGVEPDLDARLQAELAAKVGADAEVHVGFNAGAAAAAQEAAQPRPEICADQIAGILDAGSIQFAAGSAEIAPESRGVIAAVADVLRGCPGADFEIGGHTDSQGSPDDNRRLSEARAQAVLDALRQENLPDVRLTARGFGADDPVADNADVAGRAKNRRIEFTLVAPEAPTTDAAPSEAASLDPKPLPGDAGADVAEVPEAAPAPAAAGSSAQACVASIEAILASKRIDFAPGAATLAPESAPVVAQIAQVLRGCPDAAIEVGGHTDAQGSESGNLRLSQQRADAVLAALRAPDLPLAAMTARGYGEADPVADNGTDAGRQQNRRIAFTALAVQEAPAVAEGAAPPADDASAACAARIDAAEAKGKIEFAVGTATIADSSKPVIQAIGDALRQCPDVALEIGGYTDSIGSEEGNLRLSQQRADAVLAALRAPDLPLPAATARGYGESNPVADNSTFDGRNRNRRITFSLTPEETGEGDGSE
ncbi:MAG: OmpA family protein [Amaricoccus sp.]